VQGDVFYKKKSNRKRVLVRKNTAITFHLVPLLLLFFSFLPNWWLAVCEHSTFKVRIGQTSLVASVFFHIYIYTHTHTRKKNHFLLIVFQVNCWTGIRSGCTSSLRNNRPNQLDQEYEEDRSGLKVEKIIEKLWRNDSMFPDTCGVTVNASLTSK